jgi:oligopeptide/dipeptide ABC transporter ATP-binding protein
MTRPVLTVKDLRVHFFTYAGEIRALNGVDLAVNATEIVGLVGETGSGKSVLASAIMNAVRFPGRIVGGSIEMDGTDLLALGEGQLREVRGAEVSLIGTNPRSKLNPLLRVGEQIADVILAHQPMARPEALRKAVAMMAAVGVNDPERRSRAYPHELSGGMAQRILIAMALSGSPRLLIADEATNGLDVTVQRQVLDLIRDKVHERQSSALIITHDLGIVAQYCQRVAIIYAGQIVEEAPVEELFRNPRHPYTISLLASAKAVSRQKVRFPLVGARPDLANLPKGCLLAPRCPFATDASRAAPPPMRDLAPGHRVRCARAEEPLQEMALARSA